jgi:hypothetical protein
MSLRLMSLCSMSFMLSITNKPFMLSVIMLNVMMLNVVAPKNQLTMRFLSTMELAVINFSK